ncbi:Golgi apparatus membrane protein tvp18 [Apophysomyces sp. BC1021]|nr:Golgi apparatus membrane protein tvp18 [Apophysomyces sp. BC1021]
MGCGDEIKSMNFSLYGQWLGIASIILLIALGIVGFLGHVVFSIVGWVIAFILVFAEIPLCIKFCPTSPKFDTFIAYFENCYFRAAMYLVFAVVMFLSNLMGTGPLIAAAVCLLLASICYESVFLIGAAAFTGQAFASSKILGGTGVDNVV